MIMLPNVQAYHSSLNESEDARQVGNVSILPIKTKIRGPAPVGTPRQLHSQFQSNVHSQPILNKPT